MDFYKIIGIGEKLSALVRLTDEKLYKDLVTIHGKKDTDSLINELAEQELLFELAKKHGIEINHAEK